MRKIIVIAAAALAAAFVSPAFAANSVKATVNGMVCAFCAQGIEKTLMKMEATKAVFVDLKGRLVLVEAKEGMALDHKAISAAIVDAGYDVTKLEPSTQSVDELRAQRKARK